MNLSDLITNGPYIGTALSAAKPGECIRHDVRGNIGIEPTDFSGKSVRILGDIGSTYGSNAGNIGASSFSCERNDKPAFTFGKSRHSGMENCRMVGTLEKIAVLLKAGKCCSLVGDSFDTYNIGVDVQCNGGALLASSIERTMFNNCRTGVRIYAGDGGTGLPVERTNSSTGFEIRSSSFTSGDYGIDVHTGPWETTFANLEIQGQKKAGIVIRGGHSTYTLIGNYIETGKTVGPPTLIIPALVVLGDAKVVLIGGRYTSWFFEKPENVTIVGAQNTRDYALSMEHLVKVGII